MLTLLIETSTEKGAVFIFEGESLLFEELLPPGLHNSTELLPALERGLKKVQVQAKDFQLIGAGVGPGSYTGLRVGAMAAKSLSYAGKTPLVGLCALSCFSSAQDAPFAVAIDAKMGGVYLQTPQHGPLVCPLGEVLERLAGIAHLVSPNSSSLQKKLSHLLPDGAFSWEEAAPCPYAMLALARQKYAAGEFSVDGSVELLYMRKTQAEINRQSHQGM